MTHVTWIENKEEFDSLISSDEKVVVDFTAPAWCQPCKQFAPHYDLAAERSDATFVAVDVDKAPWAVTAYGIRGVPTVMLFEDGHYVKNIVGRTVVQVLSEIT